MNEKPISLFILIYVSQGTLIIINIMALLSLNTFNLFRAT